VSTKKKSSNEAYEFLTNKYPNLSFPDWVWVNANTDLKVVCPTHGEFYKTYKDLRRTSYGCLKCSGRIGGPGNNKTTEDFLTELRILYGEEVFNLYDFSKTIYVTALADVVMGCPYHGEFIARPNSLKTRRSKTPCPKCNIESRSLSSFDTKEEFVVKANKVHGNKYTYTNVIYVSSKDYIQVTCLTHGDFRTKPNWHLNGEGCPSCSRSGRSKPEDEIIQLLTSWDVPVVRDFRLKDKTEIDIYLPDHGLGIEYHGLYFHSENFKDKNYHSEKLKQAEVLGIRLIQIFEDEWLDKSDIVKSRLESLVGKSSRIYARECSIVNTIPEEQVKQFLNENHIQGYCIGNSHRVGLVHPDKGLVALMTLGPLRYGGRDDLRGLEMLRFCNLIGTLVIGGFSKIMKAAVNVSKERIYSYSDRRWSQGWVYLTNSFRHIRTSDPGYFWCKNQRRYNRVDFMKHKLKEKWPDIYADEKTESELCLEKGYVKVWDCGQDLWVYEP